MRQARSRGGRERPLAVGRRDKSVGILAARLGDRYTVERELGRGGMAVLYLATETKHARKVAITVLRPELAASLGAERFRARSASRRN